jgi:hypothetical protein
VSVIFVIWMAFLQIQHSFLTKTQNHAPAKQHQKSPRHKNAIHFPGSRILHYVRFRYPKPADFSARAFQAIIKKFGSSLSRAEPGLTPSLNVFVIRQKS